MQFSKYFTFLHFLLLVKHSSLFFTCWLSDDLHWINVYFKDFLIYIYCTVMTKQSSCFFYMVQFILDNKYHFQFQMYATESFPNIEFLIDRICLVTPDHTLPHIHVILVYPWSLTVGYVRSNYYSSTKNHKLKKIDNLFNYHYANNSSI